MIPSTSRPRSLVSRKIRLDSMTSESAFYIDRKKAPKSVHQSILAG